MWKSPLRRLTDSDNITKWMDGQKNGCTHMGLARLALDGEHWCEMLHGQLNIILDGTTKKII